MGKEIDRRTFLKKVSAMALAPLLVNCTYLSATSQRKEEEITAAEIADLEVSSTAALPPPQPAAVLEKRPVSAEMAGLRDRLASEIENYQGRTAISIADITGDESVDVNGGRAQLPGCVANLACALTVVAELSGGRAPFTKGQIEPSLTKMVRNSDPHVGLRVVAALGNGNIAEGVGKINRQMEDWEMFGSLYDHPPVYGSRYSLKGENNYIVPNEMAGVLARLARSELFKNENNDDWNDYALWVMSNNKVGLNFMIPGEIPESEATVYHKVGWFYGNPNTINDVGVVEAVDGRFKYSLAAMYENYQTNISEQSLFYGPGFFLRKLSKVTYDTFVQKYGRSQRT